VPARPSCSFALQFAEEIHRAHKGTAPVCRACDRCGKQCRLDAGVVKVDNRSRDRENSGKLGAPLARRRVARDAPSTPPLAYGPARELLQRPALPRRAEGLDGMADEPEVAATSAVDVQETSAALRVRVVPLVRLARVRTTFGTPVWTRTRDEHFRRRSRSATTLTAQAGYLAL
jgi:hypothetical protein